MRAFEGAGFTTIGVDREQADLTDAVAGLFGCLDRLDVLFTARGSAAGASATPRRPLH
jgi:hypothetical protein